MSLHNYVCKVFTIAEGYDRYFVGTMALDVH